MLTVKINGVLVSPIVHKFSDGAWRVNVKDCAPQDPINSFEITVTTGHDGIDHDQLVLATILSDAITRISNDTVSRKLILPYFPYARQDRVCDIGDSNSLRVICHMLREYFDLITTIDVHNAFAVSTYLGDRCNLYNKTNYPLLKLALSNENYSFLVCPDKGAIPRFLRLGKLGVTLPIVYCDKTRDPCSGNLLGFKINGDIPDGRGLIVDDICDGGGTFIGLAKIFNRPLDLCVTHGIFSRGLAPLQVWFNKIYCTNSLGGTTRNMSPNNLIYMNWEDLID